ncbi:unnamed protein product [Closterium sp. NIES-53]
MCSHVCGVVRCGAPTRPGGTAWPHQLSFHPLVRSLDVDNIILLVTAVLLEKRILLRATQYELLTLVAESVSHLIYPFKWAVSNRTLKLIFFRFFASILCSYRHFVDKVVEPSGHVKSTFNKASFFRKRAKVTGNTDEPLISQLLHTQCWQQFLDGSSSGVVSFFDRALVELEALDIATGPAMASVDLADDDGAPEIVTVPPPTPKGAHLCTWTGGCFRAVGGCGGQGSRQRAAVVTARVL